MNVTTSTEEPKKVNARFGQGLISESLAICQEQFQRSLEVHEDSLREANILRAYLEGEHYSSRTQYELKQARRPAERYNLLLRITRLLTGHFNKVVTTVVGNAVSMEDTASVAVHNENFKACQRLSKWDSTRKAIVDDMITTGIGCVSLEVTATGRFDELHREINMIRYKHVPYNQVLTDFRAIEPDYSDAEYVHYWEFLNRRECVAKFGEDKVRTMELSHERTEEQDLTDTVDLQGLRGLDEYENWVDGRTFYIVRTYQKEDGNIKVTYWHGDLELKVSYIRTKEFPIITIPLLRKRGNGRYYSPLYEAIPSQDAINQSLLKFQKLLDANRVIVDRRAVPKDEVASFKQKIKALDEVLEVNTLNGIRIENLSHEAQVHINKMFTSINLIMEVIGINEAFLGRSKAGDSGRKFEGQRAASENTLDYIFTPINLMYTTLYLRTVHYAGIYKTATEMLRFVDELNQSRWMRINEPFLMPTGEIVTDPDTGEAFPELEPVKTEVQNEYGDWELAYVNDKAKSLAEIEVEVDVHTAPYDDTDATESAFIESILNGMGGQILASASPQSVLYLYSLLTKSLKTRHSERIAMLFSEVSKQLGGLQIEDPRLYMQGNSFAGGVGDEAKAGSAPEGGGGSNIQQVAGIVNDGKPEGYNVGGGLR